ncbi:MAG: hypothetical protein KDD43_00855 [Bdellovibrionales bacterium]|nr:hypothetical protein [Bdellovibrionales bacterium]
MLIDKQTLAQLFRQEITIDSVWNQMVINENEYIKKIERLARESEKRWMLNDEALAAADELARLVKMYSKQKGGIYQFDYAVHGYAQARAKLEGGEA